MKYSPLYQGDDVKIKIIIIIAIIMLVVLTLSLAFSCIEDKDKTDDE